MMHKHNRKENTGSRIRDRVQIKHESGTTMEFAF